MTTPVEGVRQVFGFLERPNLAARYNIAPTQEVPAVRLEPAEAGGATGPHLVMLRWGLIPVWAKDKAIGSRMINARAETVAEKPAFRNAFRERRCLVYVLFGKVVGVLDEPGFHLVSLLASHDFVVNRCNVFHRLGVRFLLVGPDLACDDQIPVFFDLQALESRATGNYAVVAGRE